MCLRQCGDRPIDWRRCARRLDESFSTCAPSRCVTDLSQLSEFCLTQGATGCNLKPIEMFDNRLASPASFEDGVFCSPAAAYFSSPQTLYRRQYEHHL